jgi:uncharacterized membrane protein
MVMDMRRLLRHLVMPRWRVHQAFPAASMRAIEHAIRAAEATHEGQICFAVESALELGALVRGQSARERALEVYSRLRVWDTEKNDGVLIYLLLADHDVEILVDRGMHARVESAEWERICGMMETAFREGRFQDGALAGIEQVRALLAQHFPRSGPGANELSDRPVIL